MEYQFTVDMTPTGPAIEFGVQVNAILERERKGIGQGLGACVERGDVLLNRSPYGALSGALHLRGACHGQAKKQGSGEQPGSPGHCWPKS